jgi:hypothetical protein
MTKQEYFDLLVKTSKEGGFPATSSYGGCYYRSPEGKKCTIGLLIPDELYNSTMEFEDITKIITYIVPVDGFTVDDYCSVQSAHDDMAIKLQSIITGQSIWNHAEFVDKLLDVHCFQGVQCV